MRRTQPLPTSTLSRRSAPPIFMLAALLGLGCKVSGSFDLNTSKPDGEARTTGEATAVTTTTQPAAVPVRIVRKGDKLLYENGEIEFETGSAAIKEGSSGVINEFTGVLKKYPALKVRIEGRTDSRGSTESNQKLSEDRAIAIQAALARRGIDRERMTTQGFGETDPVRVEPAGCRNKSDDKVPPDKLSLCQEVWSVNRQAAFVVTDGADTLPGEGTQVSERAAPEPTPEPAPVVTKKQEKRRPDWALRFFGGYTLLLPGEALHGGHFGVAAHASQRFGKRGRGYIGGGPRLHYRAVHSSETAAGITSKLTIHQFGPEGNLLVGGGSQKVVGLFSLRLGLGLSALRGREGDGAGAIVTKANGLGGWVLGGLVVLGKLTPRWSLGGHVEGGVAGVTGANGALGLAGVVEAGLNVAWHFGRGRRDGI